MLSKYLDYIKSEGLDRLIDFENKSRSFSGPYDTVSGKINTPFPPEPADLVRLHQMIRTERHFTVLEFGIGYSTVIMADALSKNRRDWNKLSNKPAIRNRHMFQLYSVDSSKKWINTLQNKIPGDLKKYVNISYSKVEISTFNGQLCHFYTKIPNIIPDFIYLDGPSPKDVEGDINGLNFQCDERTVNAGDLLLMEPSFLPGLQIIIDGRTNNARFLQRNFKRRYKIHYDLKGDYSSFELNEKRLGKYNLLGSDFY